MRYVVRSNNFETQIRSAWRRHQADVKQAARIATDRASKTTQRMTAQRMRLVGLGRLSGGVGQTSALKKNDKVKIYGVVYARGQREVDSRTAGAIEAYSQGVTIRAKRVTWLAYSTNLIPKFVGRRRMTPLLYQTTGWQARLGPLEFRPISQNLALLVVKRLSIHPRTGRGRRLGPGKSRAAIQKKEAVAFILIRYTTRAQRFDAKSIASVYARKVPEFMAEALAEIEGRRGGG